MKFTKMHGAGNDYVFVNCLNQSLAQDASHLARRVSDRRLGIGADGLILVLRSDKADARMEIYNADGSEAEMCGNGIRCFAKYLYEHHLVRKDTLSVETLAGVLTLQLFIDGSEVQRVNVDMGEPTLDGPSIPTTIPGSPVVDQRIRINQQEIAVTCVSMGNPHCVCFVDVASDEVVHRLGPQIENSDYFPNRVNVEFVVVDSPYEVHQRTWERGTGETSACGTGASAVCVAGVLNQRTERRLLVHLNGGDLEIHWDEQTNHVFMNGPAVEVFSGEWPEV